MYVWTFKQTPVVTDQLHQTSSTLSGRNDCFQELDVIRANVLLSQ